MTSTDDLKNPQNCKFWLKKLTGLTNLVNFCDLRRWNHYTCSELYTV